MAPLVWTLISLYSLLRASALKDRGIVYPALLSERGDGLNKVLMINEAITLNLERSEVFSDDFLFISEGNSGSVHYYMKKEKYERNLYHDDQSKASVLIDTDEGVKVEGILGDTLRIKPLLEMGRSEEGHIAHMLYEIEILGGGEPRHRDYAVPNTTALHGSTKEFAEARSTTSRMYPQIHIVVDSAHASNFEYDKEKITLYLAVFINGANLRYQTMRDPYIRLRIVGITMSMTEESYMVVPEQDTNQILDEETLTEFNEYYKNKIEFIHADLLYLLTGKDMVFYENKQLVNWVGGYSFIGGMCQSYKVGMSEDPPTSFYGVQTFSHEVAHSLGCVHDGSEAVDNIPGHKGSQRCDWNNGFIMSYKMQDGNMYKFSECCKEDIRNMVSHHQWSCLLQRKKKATITSNSLPGQHTSGNNYCKRVYRMLSGVTYNKEYGVKDCKVRCDSATDYYIIAVVDGVVCDKEKKGRKELILRAGGHCGFLR